MVKKCKELSGKMMTLEKLYTMKDACAMLGVHPNTLRRWDKEKKIRCVRTPGGRRRVPESEILRILGGLKFPPPKKVVKPETTVSKETIPKPKEKNVATSTELNRHAILDELVPSGLAQRTAFGDLLSAAAVLKTFTFEELRSRARCPEPITKTFCERMRSRGYLVDKDGMFELRVRLSR